LASVGAPKRCSAFYDRFRERIAHGEIVVLDGGTGTGLQALGVPMDGEAWSAVANLTHLETVQRLHAFFLTAGADVLITNTFAAGPGPLALAGHAGDVEEANRNAVSAAAAARTQAGRDDVVIAGSMSRMVANGLSRSEEGDAGSPNEGRLRDAYRRQAGMHTDVRLVPDSLSVIATAWPGTVGAYAHVGDWTPPNWVFDDISPSAFADHARDWVSHGATVVGGCCGIGPEHIAELAAVVGRGRS
jgi:S-methylmethionine-dependent homocysteine/selenocysteine methylase